MGRKAWTTEEHGRGRVWTEDEARAALAELARSGERVAAFTRSRGLSTQRTVLEDAARRDCGRSGIRPRTVVAGCCADACRPAEPGDPRGRRHVARR